MRAKMRVERKRRGAVKFSVVHVGPRGGEERIGNRDGHRIHAHIEYK